jgi:P-type Cu+ transporter
MGKKPPMHRIVDKVAGYFAFAVMIAALSTFLVWYFVVSFGAFSSSVATAIIPAVAILVVACPCALGLATPTAIMVGMGKGASNGVIFKSGDAMEILNKISVAIFDKTGTLTEGKPQVTDVVQIKEFAMKIPTTSVINQNMQATSPKNGDNSAEVVLTLAAIAEKGSEHPLVKAIVNYAQTQLVSQLNDSNIEFEAIPGRGVIATVYNDQTIKVGNQAFLQDQNIDIS